MHTGVASARNDALAPAPLRPELGWECATFFPKRAILASSLQAGDVQLAGWFEGWAAYAGAFALGREIGAGRIVASTFRLGAAFGIDPVATALLHRLLDLLAEPSGQPASGPGWSSWRRPT